MKSCGTINNNIKYYKEFWRNSPIKQLRSKERERDDEAKTHFLQAGNSKRVPAADTKVGTIRNAAEVRGVIAKGEGNLSDVLFIRSGILTGEGGVVVVDFGVEV